VLSGFAFEVFFLTINPFLSFADAIGKRLTFSHKFLRGGFEAW
jgi:hypothetical protein